MKKGIVLFSAAVFILSLSWVSPTKVYAAEKQQQLEIGYADIAVIFESYNKKKDLDTALSTKGKQKRQELDAMAEKVKNMRSELDLLTEERRQKKQDQIDDEMRKARDFERDARETLERERDTAVRDILKEIDLVIKEYSQKNGYTMVLNSRALVFAQEQDDVTQEILNILNSRYTGTKKK